MTDQDGDASFGLCSDCPPMGHATIVTRCQQCPRRQPTRDGADGAGMRTEYQKGYSAGVIAQIDAQDFERSRAPKPAPDAMRSLLMRALPIMEAAADARSVQIASASLARDIRGALSEPVPPADGAHIEMLRKALQEAAADLVGRAEDPEDPLVIAALKRITDARLAFPSPAVAAEPVDDQDPPIKWLIESLRNLARDLLADPKTAWIGERDPKQHICWTAADRIAQADFDRRIDAILSLPVQPGAGEMEAWQWLGDELKQGDPDWVAEATEPTASELSLAVFTGGLSVWTARGKQRAKVRDFIVRIDGEIFLFSEAAWLALSRQAPHSSSETET